MGLSAGVDAHMDRFYKQDLVIGTFRNFATQRNCHVTLIIHPRKEKESEELSISSIFGGAKASQEADNILIIQKKMIQSLHIKKYIQVSSSYPYWKDIVKLWTIFYWFQIVKNRYTGELGLMPLSFNKTGLSFAGKNTCIKEKEVSTEEFLMT